MRTYLLAGLVMLLFCGCKQEAKGDEAKPGVKSALVTGLEALADAGCACKDAKCAAAVRKDVQTLADGTKKVADADFEPLQAAQARLDECLAALNPTVIEYRGLTAQVCECKDAGCAKKVSAAFSKWAAALKASKEKLPPSDAQLLVASGTKAAACLDKFDLPIPQ